MTMEKQNRKKEKLNNLTLKKDIRTFSVSPENPTGAKGEGGKATIEERCAGKEGARI